MDFLGRLGAEFAKPLWWLQLFCVAIASARLSERDLTAHAMPNGFGTQTRELGPTISLGGTSWNFLSVPNCAPEVFVHTRRHVFVVRMRDVFAYRL